MRTNPHGSEWCSLKVILRKWIEISLDGLIRKCSLLLFMDLKGMPPIDGRNDHIPD